MKPSKLTKDISGVYLRQFALGSVQIRPSLRVSVLRALKRETVLDDIPYRPSSVSPPTGLASRETEFDQLKPNRL